MYKRQVKVPAVIGLDKDEAIKVLKEKKLNGLIVKTVNDDSVEAGKIVQQSPAPNAEAKEGTNVELTVSVGKNKTIVPNLDVYKRQVQSIIDRAREALKFISKERLWLNPDCGFATFSNRPVSTFEIIEKKLEQLQIAKNALREMYE